MEFKIDPAVWEKLPGMKIVVLHADGLDNTTRRGGLGRALAEAQAELRSSWAFPNAQSDPRVAAWREAFKSLGISVKRHPSSIEALCRRVLGGKGLPPINPLVDFYNWISLRFVVPAGGWDMGDLGTATVRLHLTQGGEPFHELGAEATVEVGAGELAYSDDTEVITRHFVWRQSERGKVTTDTRELFLVSEILEAAGGELAEEVAATFTAGIAKHFGVTARAAILEAPATSWTGNG